MGKRILCGQMRDRIDWQQDEAADGAQEPAYTKILASRVPCKVTQITGDETYYGRQLEGHIDYVVTMQRSSSISDKLRPWDRGVIRSGTHNGKTVNIKWVKHIGYSDGMPPITEIYCTELVVA